MDAKRYERAIVELFFRQYPPPLFRVEPSTESDHYVNGRHSGAKRQVDVAVYRGESEGPFLMVDAKRRAAKLDVNDVESFIGMVDDVGASIGVLVVSSEYSKTARSRVRGARTPIDLHIVELEEAERWDWLRIGRAVFPWDWGFHAEIGSAVRLVERGISPGHVADALEGVPYEEWLSFVAYAVQNRPSEAEHFLRWVAVEHYDDGWRYNAAEHLALMGRLDDATRAAVIRQEADPEVRVSIIEM